MWLLVMELNLVTKPKSSATLTAASGFKLYTDPEELGMFKSYENPISTGEKKHHIEVELCQMADFVVGVGPKLVEAFRKYLGFCKKHQNVFEFTPGVFADFSSVQQVPDERKQCSVFAVWSWRC